MIQFPMRLFLLQQWPMSKIEKQIFRQASAREKQTRLFIKGFDSRFFDGKMNNNPYDQYKVSLNFNIKQTKFRLPKYVNLDTQNIVIVKSLVQRVETEMRPSRINTEIQSLQQMLKQRRKHFISEYFFNDATIQQNMNSKPNNTQQSPQLSICSIESTPMEKTRGRELRWRQLSSVRPKTQ